MLSFTLFPTALVPNVKIDPPDPSGVTFPLNFGRSTERSLSHKVLLFCRSRLQDPSFVRTTQSNPYLWPTDLDPLVSLSSPPLIFFNVHGITYPGPSCLIWDVKGDLLYLSVTSQTPLLVRLNRKFRDESDDPTIIWHPPIPTFTPLTKSQLTLWESLSVTTERHLYLFIYILYSLSLLSSTEVPSTGLTVLPIFTVVHSTLPRTSPVESP